MASHDWSRFTRRININVPVEQLYHAWATRAGIEYWFLRLSEFTAPDGQLRNREEFVQPGDRYKWLWHGWPDETVEYGEILEVNGKDFIRFTFGGPKENPMRVSVTILNEGDEKIVELTQDNIALDDQSRMNYYVGCGEGWTFHLANMKSLFEGGRDLRTKSVELKNVINK